MTDELKLDTRVELLEKIAERQEKLLGKVVDTLEGMGKTNWPVLLGTLGTLCALLIGVVSGLWYLVGNPMKAEQERTDARIADIYKSLGNAQDDRVALHASNVGFSHALGQESTMKYREVAEEDRFLQIIWMKLYGTPLPPISAYIPLDSPPTN